jgi:hypothetical protein
MSDWLFIKGGTKNELVNLTNLLIHFIVFLIIRGKFCLL